MEGIQSGLSIFQAALGAKIKYSTAKSIVWNKKVKKTNANRYDVEEMEELPDKCDMNENKRGK